MTPTIRVRINVVHQGHPQMAGRMFTHGSSLYVFHESVQDSQYHAKYNCSAPVDRLVIQEMLDLKARHGFAEAWFIHRKRGADQVQMARASDLLMAPRASFGGRDRHYLDDGAWTWAAYNEAHNPGRMHTERTLEARPADWTPIQPPQAPTPAPSPQYQLLAANDDLDPERT